MTQTPGSVAVTGARLRRQVTVDSGVSPPTALLVRDGRIDHLGDDATIRDAARADGIRVMDVGGATVTPGLFDSHSHPRWAVSLTAGVDLGGIDTLEGLRAALRTEAERLSPGAWVRGWNLEYEALREPGFDRAVLEDVVGERPMVLVCYDLHSALANGPALARAGITGPREFADTSEIVVDDRGRLTGELRELTAFRLVTDTEPTYTPTQERDEFRRMLLRLNAAGLTGGAILDGDASTGDLLAELEERDELTQRMTVHHWHKVDFDDAAVAGVIEAGRRRGRLWRGDAIKLFSDGVIDSGTAWLHQPDTCGGGRSAFWPDWDRFRQVARAYHDAGMRITTHAVGDEAVSQVLDVYAELGPLERGTHLIEHLEVLSDDDLQKLAGSPVTASMQPLHMQWRSEDRSDTWASRLGPHRSETGFRVRSVLESGTPIVLGSDWPVAHYDPRIGMAWARGRSRPGDDAAPVFEPQERLSGEQTLLAYTRWPAQARGHEDRGWLAVGAVGDLTVWADDPTTVRPDELVNLPVMATVVDGRVVHEQP